MGWLQPSPQMASQCAKFVVLNATKRREDDKMKDTMIGVDLAKRVFQVHGATMTGQVKFRKKLTREQFRRFMAEQPACVVVFEACGSASYWAREMQARAVLFRDRERVVRQRTELVNALRVVLYEYGHVFPLGLTQLKRIEAVVEVPDCDLPELIIAECRDLLAQIAEKTERIDAKTKALKALASQTDMARRLQTMPGVGPLTALAVKAFAPDMAQFKCGRDFAAWLGLVPRQHSTGGKAWLGRFSKAGQSDTRRLLIIGAMTRILGRARHKVPAESWIGQMLARKPKMLVGITLANKMARQIWAMLTKNEDYRHPARATA